MPKIYIYPFALSYAIMTAAGLYDGEGLLLRWIALTVFWICIAVIERLSNR